jgi:hypothetical protein
MPPVPSVSEESDATAALTSRDYARFGDVSKRRIPFVPGEPSMFEIEARAAGTLHMATGRTAETSINVGDAVRCQVRFGDGSRSSVVTTFALQGGQRAWSEHAVELPALSAGRLTFACHDGRSQPANAVWARPLFAPRAADESAPAVILISLDTLRADYVSGFGAPEELTPALARLGREGQRFVATTSESTWTLPSHVSLLTSRLHEFPPEEGEIVGLAQALSDQGFVTVGLTGGGYVGAAFGFQLGFDHYAEYLPLQGEETDIDLLPRVLDDGRVWLDRFADVPLFLFLHTYAVHEPTSGEMAWLREVDFPAEFDLTPAGLDDVRAHYDQLVRRTDHILEPFFEDLRQLAKTRPVTVVIVSDHGEAFGEHDNFRHGNGGRLVTLHDEVTRVPMIVWGPGHIAAAKVFDRPTMLSDIAPSILSTLGLRVPASMLGDDLGPMWVEGRSGSAYEGSISQIENNWSLRESEDKLIVSIDHDGSERFELYDISRDPGEHINLADNDVSEVATIKIRLAERLADFGVSAVPGEPITPSCVPCDPKKAAALPEGLVKIPAPSTDLDIDEGTKKRLEALGYSY